MIENGWTKALAEREKEYQKLLLHYNTVTKELTEQIAVLKADYKQVADYLELLTTEKIRATDAEYKAQEQIAALTAEIEQLKFGREPIPVYGSRADK